MLLNPPHLLQILLTAKMKCFCVLKDHHGHRQTHALYCQSNRRDHNDTYSRFGRKNRIDRAHHFE